MTKPLIDATWNIELNCECPHCEEDVDLLDDCDFWHSNGTLQIGEHGTEKSKKVGVLCPRCGEEFDVNLQY